MSRRLVPFPLAALAAAVILIYLIVGPEKTRLFAPWWVVTDLRQRVTALEEALRERDSRDESLRQTMDATAKDLFAQYADLAKQQSEELRHLRGDT